MHVHSRLSEHISRSGKLNSVFFQKCKQISNLPSCKMVSMPVLSNIWAALYSISDISGRPVCTHEGKEIAIGFVFWWLLIHRGIPSRTPGKMRPLLLMAAHSCTLIGSYSIFQLLFITTSSCIGQSTSVNVKLWTLILAPPFLHPTAILPLLCPQSRWHPQASRERGYD